VVPLHRQPAQTRSALRRAAFLLLFALLPLGAHAAEPARLRGPWTLAYGLRPELSAQGGGLGTQAAYRYRFAYGLAFDAVGRGGISRARVDAGADQFYLALGAGLGWESAAGLTDWSPRAALRFTHVHHATLESWKGTPGANLAGDSDGGVLHRSGAELALGLVAPELTDLWGQSLRWELELTGGILPSSEHFAWTTALVASFALDRVQPVGP